MSKQDRKTAAKAITDSAHQIWLAGLGAFAKAQAEGTRVFEQLIREGAELEQQTRKYTKEKVGELRGRMEDTADRLRKTGQASLERIQSAIDQRVAKAVERMAVPTKQDFAELASQMSALSRRVTGGAANDPGKGATASPRKASAAAKPAQRATAAKKTRSAKSAKSAAAPVKKVAKKTASAPTTSGKTKARKRR